MCIRDSSYRSYAGDVLLALAPFAEVAGEKPGVEQQRQRRVTAPFILSLIHIYPKSSTTIHLVEIPERDTTGDTPAVVHCLVLLKLGTAHGDVSTCLLYTSASTSSYR